MSTPNVKAVEKIALVGTIDPQTVANSEVFSDVVDLSTYLQVMGIVLLGNMANETIDAKVYRCDSAGNNAVALKSATQLAGSASANDNKQILFNVRTGDLIASGAQYIKLGVVTGNTAGGPVAVALLGVDGRYGPASHLSSVAETVA